MMGERLRAAGFWLLIFAGFVAGNVVAILIRRALGWI